MLRITPPDRLYIDVQANGTTSEDHIVLTNTLHVPVVYKIQVRPEASSAARITSLTPKTGLVMPERSQRVSITSAAAATGGGGSRGDEAAGEEWLPAVCKLIIQSKVAGGSNKECSGDKSTSLWDLSDEFIPERQTCSQEIDILINLTSNHDPLLHSTAAGPSVSFLRMPTSPVTPPRPRRCLDSSDSASVINSIQDLVSSNEVLKTRLCELEVQHQSDTQMLSNAKREIDEAKVSSQLTSHLIKQVDELRLSKESLEEEVNRLKVQDLEKREHLVEKDIKMRALSMESERLTKENSRLRDEKREYSDPMTKLSSERSHLDPIIPPRAPPRNVRSSRKLLQEQLEARTRSEWSNKLSMFNYDELVQVPSEFPLEEQPLPTIPAKEKTSDERGSFGCSDENLLFFLKNMTSLFAALTVLAAANIIVTDFVQK